MIRGSIGRFEPATPAIGPAKSVADREVLLDHANMVPIENHGAPSGSKVIGMGLQSIASLARAPRAREQTELEDLYIITSLKKIIMNMCTAREGIRGISGL